jgi:HAD superfamily hydrolase (TIGR01484 family)
MRFPREIRLVKQLVVFDLDGTLAESKSSIDRGMVALLNSLLDVTHVAVISGGDWPQFEKQVLSGGFETSRLANLSLLPTSGTKFYVHRADWEQLYAENLTDAEKAKITAALHQARGSSGTAPSRVWGAIIEDRGTQITYSALGQEAPLEEKKGWDPDFAKRKKMKDLLDDLIPEFSVRLGGTTSIDVTRPGIDKAYGIRKLREVLGIDIQDMIFIGDALFPGGNDYAAEEAGVVSIEVKGPGETQLVIKTILACLGHAQPTQPVKAT